jgi:hypothetical protein
LFATAVEIIIHLRGRPPERWLFATAVEKDKVAFSGLTVARDGQCTLWNQCMESQVYKTCLSIRRHVYTNRCLHQETAAAGGDGSIERQE